MSFSNGPKKIAGVLLVAFVLSAAYYGTYLPMRKSQIFISTMRNLNTAQTLEEVGRMLEIPLAALSPIGQEELVRNSANVFQDTLNRTDDPAAISKIMDFVEEHYRRIIERGRGMSFGQNLYVLGVMNEFAFIKTKQSRYLDSSERYYTIGIELGPKRPQPLYGLFDVYRIRGNIEKSKEIADRILGQWPNDDMARRGLAEFLEKVGTNKNAR